MTLNAKRTTLHSAIQSTTALLVLTLAACQQSYEESFAVDSAAVRIEQNKAMVRQSIEEMDNGNWSVFLELYAPDYVSHYPGQPIPLTREEHREAAQAFYASFPDARHTIHEIIAEDDMVVVRLTDRGTHEGDFQGISPTGTQIEFGVISIYRISNGKIAEVWMQGDLLGLNQQLGMELISPQATAR